MYSLSSRLKISAIIPLALLLVSTVNFLKIYNLPIKSTSLSNNIPALWSYFWLLFDLFLIYIISVCFFSVETLVRIYIIDKDNPSNQSLKNQFKLAPISKKLSTLINYETQSLENKITHSVIFQVALFLFTFFVISSASSLIGKGIVLSIGLMILWDQGQSLYKNQQINSWFWQIKTNISRVAQQSYFAICVAVYILLFILSL